MSSNKLTRLIDEIIFPTVRSCLICGEKHQSKGLYICKKCYDDIKRVYSPVCKNCGRPLISQNNCTQCFNKHYDFSSVISYGIYEKPLRDILHLFKYKRYSGIGLELAKIMARDKNIANAINNSLLVPIPLHPQKIHSRGYNQSEVICEYFAKHTSAKYANILMRKENTLSQSSYKLNDRKLAIRNQFKIKKRFISAIRGTSIILIDDVITTGSTLNEAAKTLRINGAIDVKAITIATTLLK